MSRSMFQYREVSQSMPAVSLNSFDMPTESGLPTNPMTYANSNTPLYASANNAILNGNTTITGDLVVDGSTTLNDYLSVNGKIYVNNGANINIIQTTSNGNFQLGNDASANPVVQVLGSAGAGTVYDSLYNPPYTASQILFNSQATNVRLINTVSMNNTNGNIVISPFNIPATNNNIQIQASKQFVKLEDPFSTIEADSTYFNNILYVKGDAQGTSASVIQIKTQGDLMPIGTTISICRDPASDSDDTLTLLYDTTALVGPLNSSNNNVIYTFTKVNNLNTSADWVKLTIG